MYSLTVCFGPAATTWAFLYKEKAKVESQLLYTDLGVFHDDYGQHAQIKASDIHGWVLEDLDLTDEAKIVRSLANARNEVKARQRATTDPVIRSGMQQGGPSVLTPFNRN